MPAVSLSRLKDQIQLLAAQFQQPEAFCQSTNRLLSQYSDRTYKAGDTVPQPLLINAYRPPVIVMQQFEMALTRCAGLFPEAVFSVADRLWQEAYLEPRLLAAFLLGQAAVPPPEPVLQRLTGFCQGTDERRMLIEVITRSSYSLRAKTPVAWLNTIDGWLSSGNHGLILAGIISLNTLASDTNFANLPGIFQRLNHNLPHLPRDVFPEIEAVIKVLVERSSGETTHFLRQVISTHNDENLRQLIRQIIPALPAEMQAGIRQSLAAADKTP